MIDALTDAAMVLLALTNLSLIGMARLATCIRVVALQGFVLSVLPLLAHADDLTARTVVLAVGTLLVKSVVFPWLLMRALHQVDARHEQEPFVGFGASLLVGVVVLGIAIWLGARLPFAGEAVAPLVFPMALFTMFVGLFVLVSRRKALTQVLGYLVLENGIYTFGIMLVGEIPVLVELGALLDVLVAVLVMGVAIHHISREFDHIDIDELDHLRG